MALLALIDRVLLDEIHVMVSSPSKGEGVIHGRGLAPSVASSVKEERTRCSPGACPMGATLAVKSESLRRSWDLVFLRKAEESEQGDL